MHLRQIGSNQTEITINTAIGELRVFFSYETPVAAIDENGNHYRTEKYWSRTTSKHINGYLEGSKSAEMPQEWFDDLLKNEKPCQPKTALDFLTGREGA